MEETFDMNQHSTPPTIDKDFILNQVEEVVIYRHYLGPFILGKKIKNPFRKDEHPSFSLYYSSQYLKLRWKDHATGEHGDCFSLVGKILNLNFFEALHRIASDFGLIKGTRTIGKKQLEEAQRFKEDFQQKEFIVQFEPRKMEQYEIDYWNQYSITQADLKANNIYAIKTLWVNKKQFFLRSGLHFAYYFPSTDKLKIYSPYDKEWKWFGNASSLQMEGVDKLIPSMYEPLIITKSRKDRIILSKLYPNVCSTQNEAETAIPKEMDAKFDQIYPAGKFCWFDSDEPGKAANRKLNYRGYKWINVPNKLYETYGVKDPSDVIKHFGWAEGSKILLKEINKKIGYGTKR